MSANNGVIRIGRKGIKKFAFGEDGAPFQVDVVVAFQQWVAIDDKFREASEDRSISIEHMSEYHLAAQAFAKDQMNQDDSYYPTTAEALDFIARLREQYDEVAAFFQPKLREESNLPDSMGAELRFSVEDS